MNFVSKLQWIWWSFRRKKALILKSLKEIQVEIYVHAVAVFSIIQE